MRIRILLLVAAVVGVIAGAVVVARLYPQIVSGVDATAGEFPGVVAIRYAKIPNKHRCAGVVAGDS